MSTINVRLNGTQVALPEEIPVRKTAEAFEAAIAFKAEQGKVWRERDKASDALRDAGNLDAERLGEAYFDDPSAIDQNPSAELESARKKRDDLQAKLSGMAVAEGKHLERLRVAVRGDSTQWALASRAGAKKAIVKLTTAARMAAQARDDLAATVGVLGMLKADTLVVTPGRHSVSLDIALTSLYEALRDADDELKSLS